MGVVYFKGGVAYVVVAFGVVCIEVSWNKSSLPSSLPPFSKTVQGLLRVHGNEEQGEG